jgi:hypothetical protein
LHADDAPSVEEDEEEGEKDAGLVSKHDLTRSWLWDAFKGSS